MVNHFLLLINVILHTTLCMNPVGKFDLFIQYIDTWKAHRQILRYLDKLKHN